MRICIPIEFRPQGGGFYFLQAFSSYLRNQGWDLVSSVTEPHDILFTNHWMTPLSEIFKAVRHNPKVRIVHRIDGSAEDYGRDPEADRRQGQVNRFADLTVFQSHYARFATREKFSVIPQDGPVIYNPVDLETFNPEGPKRTPQGVKRIACVAWSTNPMKGADRIYEVAVKNPDLIFVMCGNFKIPALQNMESLGVLGRSELAAALRSCGALLTFSRNEACPNHVLEGLASGLPVLYDDSGAMKEVVGGAGMAVTVESFRDCLNSILKNAEAFSLEARNRAVSMFDAKIVLGHYLRELASLKPESDMVRSIKAWIGYPAKGN